MGARYEKGGGGGGGGGGGQSTSGPIYEKWGGQFAYEKWGGRGGQFASGPLRKVGKGGGGGGNSLQVHYEK